MVLNCRYLAAFLWCLFVLFITWDWVPSESLAASTVTKKYSLTYSDDIDDYSDSIPTATASGTYKVYYGIDGGSYYQDWGFSKKDYIEVTIAPAKVSETYSKLSPYNEKEEFEMDDFN